MAITYNSVDIRGKAAEPIFGQIMFENDTIAKGLVNFEDDIKAETIFTEADAQAVLQAYTSGEPVSAGSLSAFDTVVTPIKFQTYHEFDPNTLRFSRFKRSMKKGAWEIMSTEFESIVVMGIYAKRISLAMEYDFWNGVKASTKTAIAGLTAGTANNEVGAEEQAYIAGLTIGTAAGNVSGLIDGVITKAIYNNSNETGVASVGGRKKIVGTTITSANIKAEYDKIYAGIEPEVLSSGEEFVLYAPKSHKQLITIFNNNVANFKDAFEMSGDSAGFNGIKIEFAPLKDNVVYGNVKSNISWCTDLLADINDLRLDKIAANREDMFLKTNSTLAAHIAGQKFSVLYVG